MRRQLPVFQGTSPGTGVSRRDALVLLAAMGAAAALPACRRPEQKILPYVRQPEEIVPGRPLHFATVLPLMGTAFGIVVESHEGHPTKIEGNPAHPESLGATSAFIQAAILDLYDTERSRSPYERSSPRSWLDAEAMLTKLGTSLTRDQGRSLAVVTNCHRSPTFMAALRDLRQAYPGVRIARYEPFSSSNSELGTRWIFGRALAPVYDFRAADVVLSLDSDFMGLEGSPVRAAREWADRRASDAKTPNRLYVVESTLSITGSNADHRVRLSSAAVPAFACALAVSLASTNIELPPELTRAAALVVERYPEAPYARATLIAKELARHRGRSLILAGARQPAPVHAIAHVLNHALGNVGASVRFVRTFDDEADRTTTLAEIAEAVRAGSISTLMLFGVNPVYDTPADLDFADAAQRVPLSLHMGTHFDETAARCTWHLNRTHALEAWSDAVSENGTASVAQPLISPLYDGRTETEVLRHLLGKKATDFDWVRDYWQNVWGAAAFEAQWRHALHNGIANIPAYHAESVTPSSTTLARELENSLSASAAPYELVFTPDSHTYDGRFANNPWLQELPDPLTKSTYTNVARISRFAAKTLGLQDGDIVKLSVNGREIQTPVIVVPGQADRTVAVTIGHGRHTGVLGVHRTGANVNPLRMSQSPYLSPLSALMKVGGSVALPRTQEHFDQEGRPLALLERFDPAPSLNSRERASPRATLRSESEIAWSMAIDLGKCTGCNACIVACQAENNSAVVGIEGIRRHREMQWLRIDRYYAEAKDELTTVAQPVLCQQCEKAPCESVCPVGATSHSPDGLNDMTYNRCVGSRYCANNCPFKVRHFNYFEYWANVPTNRRLQLNPDVTVRSRGVMEKCTFCVQRINRAEIDQKLRGKSVVDDGTVETACSQVCPTQAITFGNLADPESRVSKAVRTRKAYRLLEDLALDTRVFYVPKRRNPNPEIGT